MRNQPWVSFFFFSLSSRLSGRLERKEKKETERIRLWKKIADEKVNECWPQFVSFSISIFLIIFSFPSSTSSWPVAEEEGKKEKRERKRNKRPASGPWMVDLFFLFLSFSLFPLANLLASGKEKENRWTDPAKNFVRRAICSLSLSLSLLPFQKVEEETGSGLMKRKKYENLDWSTNFPFFCS